MLAAAGSLLAACGSVHPGAAAVVGSKTISMSTLERTAEAYCVLTLSSAQQQGVESVSNSDIRRQAVVSLVSTIVARDLAKADDLTIAPRLYTLGQADLDQIRATFPDADQDALKEAIEQSQEVSAIAVALAARQTGQTPDETNQAALDELGRAAIMKAFKEQDVKFAPRFGLSPSGAPRAATGTLSVTPVDLEAPAAEELPDTQRCS